MSNITGLGRRDGSSVGVETILELDGDKKDYVLRKTSPNRVTLFKLTGHNTPAK